MCRVQPGLFTWICNGVGAVCRALGVRGDHGGRSSGCRHWLHGWGHRIDGEGGGGWTLRGWLYGCNLPGLLGLRIWCGTLAVSCFGGCLVVGLGNSRLWLGSCCCYSCRSCGLLVVLFTVIGYSRSWGTDIRIGILQRKKKTWLQKTVFRNICSLRRFTF